MQKDKGQNRVSIKRSNRNSWGLAYFTKPETFKYIALINDDKGYYMDQNQKGYNRPNA